MLYRVGMSCIIGQFLTCASAFSLLFFECCIFMHYFESFLYQKYNKFLILKQKYKYNISASFYSLFFAIDHFRFNIDNFNALLRNILERTYIFCWCIHYFINYIHTLSHFSKHCITWITNRLI